MKKFIIDLIAENTYEIEAETEQEALDIAYEYFRDCEPCIENIEEEGY